MKLTKDDIAQVKVITDSVINNLKKENNLDNNILEEISAILEKRSVEAIENRRMLEIAHLEKLKAEKDFIEKTFAKANKEQKDLQKLLNPKIRTIKGIKELRNFLEKVSSCDFMKKFKDFKLENMSEQDFISLIYELLMDDTLFGLIYEFLNHISLEKLDWENCENTEIIDRLVALFLYIQQNVNRYKILLK